MKKAIIYTLFTLIFSIKMMAINPSKIYKEKPEKYNMEYKEVKVKTNDGEAELNVWDFPCKNKKTTQLILILHNGEGNMANYLRRVDNLRSNYNVVIFDYRGYGESSDFEIDNNMYIYPQFQDDVKTMIDYCRRQFVSTFNLYGWGIGGGLALGIGYNSPEIENIIADTPFLSMEDLEERFQSWDEPMEVPFTDYQKRYEPIYTLDSPPSSYEGITKKIKLIISSNDILFKLDDMEKLQAKQKNIIDKDIYIVKNPDRKDNFLVDTANYFNVISKFLSN